MKNDQYTKRARCDTRDILVPLGFELFRPWILALGQPPKFNRLGLYFPRQRRRARICRGGGFHPQRSANVVSLKQAV